MRYRSLVLALVLTAAMAYAKEPKAYQSGQVLQMESEQCGVNRKSAASDRQESLCQQFVLQTEQVIYRIRPRQWNRPVLLLVGEWAQFRTNKNRLLLRVDALDNKEREFVVVSMTPRGENTANANRIRLNHLQ
jgi:hypothetical protein